MRHICGNRRTAAAGVAAALAFVIAAAGAAVVAGPARAGALDPEGPVASDMPQTPAEVVVVTASRAGGSSAATATIDRSAIETRQPAGLLELLDASPGVRAVTTGGPGGGSAVSLRGGEANFTAILLDGVRLNDPTNVEGGAFDFGLLDPQLVARIEVVPSAVSAVHGADALSGAVQIVTRNPTTAGPDTSGAAWIDTVRGTSLSASASTGWGSGGVLAAVGTHDSGTDDPAGTARRDQLFIKATQTAGSLDLSLMALHAGLDATGFAQDSGGPQLAVIRTPEVRTRDLDLLALTIRETGTRTGTGTGTGRGGGSLRPHLILSLVRQDGLAITPPIAPGVLRGVPAVTARDRFERGEATGWLAWDAAPALTVSGGASFVREDGASTGSLDFGFPLPVVFARVRETRAVFAEAAWRPSQAMTVEAALRRDSLSGADATTTWRLGLGWSPQALSGVRLSASAGTGFKPPSLYALGHPLIGDPGLRPERSRAVEAGLSWPVAGGTARLVLFESRYRDLIDFDPAAFRLTNRDRVTVRGATVSARFAPATGWELDAAVTRLDVDSPTPLRGRPDWQGDLTAIRRSGPLELFASLRWTGTLTDSSIPTGPVEVPATIEADAGVSWRLAGQVRVGLMVRDLGDGRRPDAVGTPGPGRSLRLSLQVG